MEATTITPEELAEVLLAHQALETAKAQGEAATARAETAKAHMETAALRVAIAQGAAASVLEAITKKYNLPKGSQIGDGGVITRPPAPPALAAVKGAE